MTQRDRILRCACELYVTDGLKGLSMRRVARRLGVTAPALYRHFEDRNDLVFELIGEAFDVFARHLYRALEGETPRERLRLAGDAYLRFALDETQYYELLFVSPAQLGAHEMPEEICARGGALHQFMTDRIRECMNAGILREDDAQSVALTLWALSHGLVSLYVGGKLRVERPVFEAMYRGSFRRLFEGLEAPAAAAAGVVADVNNVSTATAAGD